MSVSIPAFPGLPSHELIVTLGDVKVTVRFYWRPRLRAWYMDLLSADGTTRLISGRRLSPGTSPNIDRVLEDGPDGLLFVSGLDGYAQADLGGSLVLKFFTRAELAEAASSASSDLVVELAE